MRTTAAVIFFVLAVMSAQQAAAQQACPSLVVSTTDDEVNGDTLSPCALIANPGPDGISLREALVAANNATGFGTITITFAPSLAGATIALTKQFPPITRNQITVSGLTNNGQPDITIDASTLSDTSPYPGIPILFIAASYFTMSGLNFPTIPSNFVGVQIGGSAYDLGSVVTSLAQLCCVQVADNAFSNGAGDNTFAVLVSPDFSNAIISNVAITDNSFTHLFEAINLQGGGGAPPAGSSNTVIQDVTIFDNSFSQMTSIGTSGVELGDTLGTSNTIRRVNVVQNTFTGNFQGVILDINSTTSSSRIQDSVIARNVFVGNMGAMGLEAGVDTGTTNNVIANTQIVDNLVSLTGYNGQGAATIQIQDNQSGTNNKVTGVSFVNNTIDNGTSASPSGWGVWVTSSGGVNGVSIENTIFWGNEFEPSAQGNNVAQPGQLFDHRPVGLQRDEQQHQRRSAVRERFQRQFRTAIRQSGPARRHQRRRAGDRHRLPATRRAALDRRL